MQRADVEYQEEKKKVAQRDYQVSKPRQFYERKHNPELNPKIKDDAGAVQRESWPAAAGGNSRHIAQ